MNLLEIAAVSHRRCTKGVFERRAKRKQVLPGFGLTPAHVQGRVAAASGPIRHQIAEQARWSVDKPSPSVALDGEDGTCAGGAEQHEPVPD